MAHYAFLDENNVVTEVIVGVDETELIQGQDPETWYGNFRGQDCKRTSYNNKIRKRYAMIGGKYDSIADEFVKAQPFASWTLDVNNDWQPPTLKTNELYVWDEESLSWVDPLDSFID